MRAGQCGFRLSSGGLIDRNRTITFTFNGRTLSGHPGDTLASALIANGVNIVGRSFKYHRPRGLFAAGAEDPNSMLAIRDAYGYEPALRAGQVRLCEGLEARSVTGWPSPSFDVAAAVQLCSGILAAGFYYKTFKWPSWRLFEPFIKRSTGFGRPKELEETRTAFHQHRTCDVLIVGGGPAGLLAARALKDSGLKVVLADDQPTLGGCLNWEPVELEGRPGVEWARGSASELTCSRNLTILTSTTVTAAYEANFFTLLQSIADDRGVRAERLWILQAEQVVLASGCLDRPLVFAGNDRPGVFLSAGVRRLIGEFGVSPGARLCVFTNNDSGHITALQAAQAGVEVACIVDTRDEASLGEGQLATRGEIPRYFASHIVDTRGYRRLNQITIEAASGRQYTIAATALAVTGGSTPLIHLASHRGVKSRYDDQRGALLASSLPVGWHCAGGAAGAEDFDTAFSQGWRAAFSIANARSVKIPPITVESVRAHSMGRTVPLWRPKSGKSSRMWVDFQNDVKVSDIELAARENYRSVEHMKRYTTLGMGTDQGKTSNVNGLAIMAELFERPIQAIGTTTFRPPYIAVRMGAIANRRAGDAYKPRRFLPAHRYHENQLAAVFEDFGWERPDWYRLNGEDRESAVGTEMAAVRSNVGVFDGSSLGKIEITGPDAAAFISRFYVSNMASLKPGRIRYSLMLKDDGVIFDDGVVACLDENHYLASPTSGQAEAVAAWFEQWRQTEWPSMQVAITPVTSAWASIAIAGPQARALLARLDPNFDISNAAFSHMEFREGQIAKVPARIARVSFTGELQYEIAVPARYGTSLLEALLTRQAELQPRVVGIEAWMRLRLEKGYLHVGSDTNGRTTPLDVGMAGIVSKRQDDFIGKRALGLAFATSPEREQLIGLRALDDALPIGARVMAHGHEKAPCPTEGYVTSACFSPAANAWIGLALIERGFERKGETITLYAAGRTLRAQICEPVFYDPSHERLRT